MTDYEQYTQLAEGAVRQGRWEEAADYFEKAGDHMSANACKLQSELEGFTCSICGAHFRTVLGLQEHNETIHDGK